MHKPVVTHAGTDRDIVVSDTTLGRFLILKRHKCTNGFFLPKSFPLFFDCLVKAIHTFRNLGEHFFVLELESSLHLDFEVAALDVPTQTQKIVLNSSE